LILSSWSILLVVIYFVRIAAIYTLIYYSSPLFWWRPNYSRNSRKYWWRPNYSRNSRNYSYLLYIGYIVIIWDNHELQLWYSGRAIMNDRCGNVLVCVYNCGDGGEYSISFFLLDDFWRWVCCDVF
jgi:hypothetical protein